MRNMKQVVFFLSWFSMISSLVPIVSGAGERWLRPGPRLDRAIPSDPEVAWFVSPDGNDAADGRTRQTAYATIQQAVDRVQPGETVLVTKGVYRQGVHIRGEGRPDAWISIVAEPGAEIRGSEIRRDWKRVEGDAPIYETALPVLMNQKPDADLKARNEQVFVDGALLLQVPDSGMLKPRGTFYADDAGRRLLVCLADGRDPNEALTEVTVQDYAIAIGMVPNRNSWSDPQVGLENQAAFVRLDGFTIRHVANFARMGAIEVRGRCRDILIENCDVQWVNTRGIALSGNGYFDTKGQRWVFDYPERITVRHCTASHCGIQGAATGGGGGPAVFEYNIFDDNNYKSVSPYAEGGGIKSLGFTNVTMRGNLLRNNDNHGLWFDYGNHGGHVIENNFVFNCLAGALLNECTPAPTGILNADGTREVRIWTLEELLAAPRAGTIIRNNILIGTRTPGGVGIPNSTSSDAKICNNIVAFNQGEGIQIAGSPTRANTTGLHRNRAWANIVYRNRLHARMSLDEECPRGLFFGNLMVSNLFSRAEAELPFLLGGVPSDAAAFTVHNEGAPNVFEDLDPFVDAEAWDFRLRDESVAKTIGFDPDALRLDWSEFLVERPRRETTDRSSLVFTPIDLEPYFNRGLVDEVEKDGKGGWTDHGDNDMRHLPLGTQVFDGVTYRLGARERGAILLAPPRPQAETFPESVDIPVGQAFDELYVLFTAAGLQTGETARLTFRYDDGTEVEQPLVAGRNLFDWWCDPTWQQNESMNLNGSYVAWQGANGRVARVTVYYLRWVNPRPGEPIVAVRASNAHSGKRSWFFLLAISGARGVATGSSDADALLRLPFDGDVDGLDSRGYPVKARGYNAAAFDAGRFVEGRLGRRAFEPRTVLQYTMPPEFPDKEQGMIEAWIKLDDWDTPERRASYAARDYPRFMTAFEMREGSFWQLGFEADEHDYSQLHLRAVLGGRALAANVTDRVRPGEWLHVVASWEPDAAQTDQTVCTLWLNRQELASESKRGRPARATTMHLAGRHNGVCRLRGAIQDLTMRSRPATAEEIAAGNGSFSEKITSTIRAEDEGER